MLFLAPIRRLFVSAALLFSVTIEASSAPDFRADGLVEYHPGDLPLILVSGHDGRQRPARIADRLTGIRGNDQETQALTRQLHAAFQTDTAASPHLVICDLARVKVDVNRDLPEAQEGDPVATAVWHAYHGAIEQAAQAAIQTHGFAFVVDIHRHKHRETRLELGHLVTRDELNLSDDELNAPSFAAKSSLQLAASRHAGRFSDLLRGPDSLGFLYTRHELRSIPSPAEPAPGRERFYSGGFTTLHHTGKPLVDGVQIEVALPDVQDPDYRARFTAATIAVLREFLSRHYDHQLPSAFP